MSTFQIPIFIGQSNVTDTKVGSPGFSTIVRTTIFVPFQNGRRVQVVSIDCVHSLAGVPTPLLCVLNSDQIYNPVAGSRDIIFTSYGSNQYDQIFLNPNFQNNESTTITLQNLDPDDADEMIDNFKYFLMTLKIV
jgi:hypothetical protein